MNINDNYNLNYLMKDENSSILSQIEEKLKILNEEKSEIENKFGINEDILEKYLNNPEDIIPNKKQIINEKISFENLPKLTQSKEHQKKLTYKTSEKYKESLKYEPSIDDIALFTPSELFFKNTNINDQKTPQIVYHHNFNKYVDYLNKKYNNYSI